MAEKKIYIYHCAWCGKELLFNTLRDVALCGYHKKYYYKIRQEPKQPKPIKLRILKHPEKNIRFHRHLSQNFRLLDELSPQPVQRKKRCKDSPYNQFQITSEGSCCAILKDHHEKLKEDPERLTTNFIKKLSHCRCKIKE
jgi:hypothetical protein